jgi:hypothetical protein
MKLTNRTTAAAAALCYSILVVGCWTAAPSAAFSIGRPLATVRTVAATATTTTAWFAVSYESIADIGYHVPSIHKPLGVVFSENEAPYYGLVVEDVEPGLAGGVAGLRKGDQLLTVNQQMVIGEAFESVMTTLRTAPDPMQLTLFRGTARQLYTILGNRQVEETNEDDDNEDEDRILMDENYESPVKVPIDDDEFGQDNDAPLTVGEVFTAFQKMGSMVADRMTPSSSSSTSSEKKKGKGLFGGLFSQETIQLDGDDASTIK